MLDVDSCFFINTQLMLLMNGHYNQCSGIRKTLQIVCTIVADVTAVCHFMFSKLKAFKLLAANVKVQRS